MSDFTELPVRIHSIKPVGDSRTKLGSGEVYCFNLEISIAARDMAATGLSHPGQLVSKLVAFKIIAEKLVAAWTSPKLNAAPGPLLSEEEFKKAVRDAVKKADASPRGESWHKSRAEAEAVEAISEKIETAFGDTQVTIRPTLNEALCGACGKVILHRGETSCWKCGWKRG
jgi:hypothetical protein